MHDLCENVLIIWDQLCEQLGKSRFDINWELFDGLTMQSQKFEARGKLDSDSDITELKNFMTFLARLMQYEVSGNRARFLEDNRSLCALEYVDEKERDFVVRLDRNTMQRRFCILSAENRIALVPNHTEIGDGLASIKGGSVPLVLRQVPEDAVEDGKAYEIIGDAYVSGLMMGEVMQKDGFVWDKIVLL